MWEMARVLAEGVSYMAPAYRSFKAIESGCPEEQAHVLVYWCVHAVVHILVAVTDAVYVDNKHVFPILRSVFLIAIAQPRVVGRERLYECVIAPFLAAHEDEIDRAVARARAVVARLKTTAKAKAKATRARATNKFMEELRLLEHETRRLKDRVFGDGSSSGSDDEGSGDSDVVKKKAKDL